MESALLSFDVSSRHKQRQFNGLNADRRVDEVRIGFVPVLMSAYLALQIGDKRSRDLLLTGRFFDAEE